MGIGPKTPSSRIAEEDLKVCSKCGEAKKIDQFAETRSLFFTDGHIPFCIDCVNQFFDEHNGDWKYVDKLCQCADIPFVPKEWVRLQEIAGQDAFLRYAQIFLDSQFEGFGWGEYFREYERLKEERKLEDQVPEMAERKRKDLIKKWDGPYSDEDFERLEDLFNGMLRTQNVITSLQMDQALKLCKLSLEIDSRIREGGEVDKLLNSYEKLVKIANFTPKNSKSASDLESTGELFRWLEAGGWTNKFYDNVTRDVVDETLKNIESWNQRLYINETGIGEEITRRTEALRMANQAEQSIYDTDAEFNLNQHEVDGYNELQFMQENEDFRIDLEEGEDDE